MREPQPSRAAAPPLAQRVVRARCVIAGGGPAGIVLGYLLARAGIDVIVAEKHADFLRDFRGDTIHPSTLQLAAELGLLPALLRVPHTTAQTLALTIGARTLTIADFRHLAGPANYLAFMPQWDLLDFFVREARRFPTFRLEMNAEIVGLLYDRTRIAGAIASTTEGCLELRADLVVAADGRGSLLRRLANLPVRDLGAPIDVMWMRVGRPPVARDATFGTIGPGAAFITIDRGTYFQCALVIGKGRDAEIRARGLDAFRARIVELAPFLAPSVGDIRTWDDVKLLTVRVDRSRRWYRDGLLCIGDAAHAMSPVGGVGINLAIQDAVATANALTPALERGRVPMRLLRAVQRRRSRPAMLTQLLQIAFHRLVLQRVLASPTPRVPAVAALLERWPWVRRIPAYVIGVGFRPEHARIAERAPASLRSGQSVASHGE